MSKRREKEAARYAKEEARRARRERRRRERRADRLRKRYWLTPKAWRNACSHCGASGSIAYRHKPRAYACAACVERLGIDAGESKAWQEGGAQAGSTVTVRFECPVCGGPHPRAECSQVARV